jgi:hypothetical protein
MVARRLVLPFLGIVLGAVAFQDSRPNDDRKRLAEIFEFVEKNVGSPDKVGEVRRQIDIAEAMVMRLHLAPAEFQRITDLRVRNAATDVDSRIAIGDALKTKDSGNLAAIANAYWRAEESCEDVVGRVLRVHGASESLEAIKATYGRCRTEADRSAEAWGNDPKLGFAARVPHDLLESPNIASRPATRPWSTSPMVTLSRELVVRGVGVQSQPMRAGRALWAPGGREASTEPLTPDVIRNYELTLRFRVVSKGFTLLSRASMGYMRHAFDFLTDDAKKLVRAASPAGGSAQAPHPNETKSESAPSADVDYDGLTVSEGNTYEIRERVLGSRVTIDLLNGKSWKQICDGIVRARMGGIGFQVLPGAEVRFDKIEIKILN